MQKNTKDQTLIRC
jgi:hypothetical protein